MPPVTSLVISTRKRAQMPRLTHRVFTDLALWMIGFGLIIGIGFPPFSLLLGLPAEHAFAPGFWASTILAGLIVSSVSYGLARVVVGRRLGMLAYQMGSFEAQLARAAFSHDWTTAEMVAGELPVDSNDEIGTSAAAFNRLMSTLTRSHATEISMRNFSAILSSQSELEELGHAALEELLRNTNAQAGAILVVRDVALEPLASYGLRSAESLAGSDHVRRVLRTGRTELLTVESSEFVIDSLLLAEPAHQILITAVEFRNASLGAIVLAKTTRFETNVEKLLEQFSAELGLAVNNALAHDRLERLAAVDPLTEIYNRLFGLRRLGEEFSRAIRSETPLGLLMFDLDHFKLVNDTHGHLVGDRTLKSAAKAAKSVLREGDVLLRYGGEEFLVILPGATIDDVARVGERIRQAISETSIVEGGRHISVTVSLGGATYRDTIDSTESLIAAVDAAMYEAKGAGRNRVVLAS
jgi:two-component system cell cycle response regulator